MIPYNLHWAYEEGHQVQTPGGKGKTQRRQLANLVLPTGNLLIGYPGDDKFNVPTEVHISPGTYSVFVTLARHKRSGSSTIAFVTINFLPTQPVRWEKAGEFFTDTGDGVLLDVGFRDQLRRKKSEMSLEQWQELKMSALENGDGNLVLDDNTGTNAIVFRTCDWLYECFLGRDMDNHLACLVIDGRVLHPPENRISLALRAILGR